LIFRPAKLILIGDHVRAPLLCGAGPPIVMSGCAFNCVM
jgi:hypothetical protein